MSSGRHRMGRPGRRRLRILALVTVVAASTTAAAAAYAEIHEPPDEDAVAIAAPSDQGVDAPLHHAPPAPRPHRLPVDLYRHTKPNDMSPTVRGMPERVYVPDNTTDTVTVIDPKTFKIVDVYPVGALPQHVTPSWDLRRLYADDSGEDALTVIDPRTSRPLRVIHDVAQPYNLYFTPDGSKAIDVVEYQN